MDPYLTPSTSRGDLAFYDASNTADSFFGWAHPSPSCLYSQLYITIVVDIGGTLGYIASMKYFDPLVISVIMLAEPIMATAQGIAVGVSSIPDIYAIIGSFVVILGASLVIINGSKKEDTVESSVEQARYDSVPSPPRLGSIAAGVK